MEQNMTQASAKHISLHMAIRGSMIPLASNDPDDRETSSGEPQSRERRDEVTKMATGTTYATGEARNDIAVLGNSESLTTAVKNLIENAIRYSSQYASVAVGIDQKNDNVIIRVVDQGSGIPQAALDRIFERFYRVDPARSRQTGGSGLGLSIAKHCVEENGGALSVWSHEGIGSTFTIELPAVHSTTGAVKDT
jgi:two-component system sensor histidine kinase SenX3